MKILAKANPYHWNPYYSTQMGLLGDVLYSVVTIKRKAWVLGRLVKIVMIATGVEGRHFMSEMGGLRSSW